MTQEEMSAEETAMWLELARLVDKAKGDKRGEYRADQEYVALKLNVDVETLVDRVSKLPFGFAALLMGSKDIAFDKNFVGMLRAWADSQPEDPHLTETEARKRVARQGAAFMDAGQHFDDRTLARMTGVPHYHVGQIIREFEFEVDSGHQLLGTGLYASGAGDADKWRTIGFPLAKDANEPLLVFNIERMETTKVINTTW